jgi:ser/thr/tyr protein kinase RAD53
MPQNGEYADGGETQGATQQASQYAPFYNGVESPFFGCLQPCHSALRRIDFQKTHAQNTIGRGPANDFVLTGMRVSEYPAFFFSGVISLSTFFKFFFFSGGEERSLMLLLFMKGYQHCRIIWDGREDRQSQVVVHDNSSNGTWVRQQPFYHLRN